MSPQHQDERSSRSDVTSLWLAMHRLREQLDGAKSDGDFENVRLEARRRIRDLAALRAVDRAVRGRILKVLEVVERDPASVSGPPDELADAVGLCRRLLPPEAHAMPRTPYY